MLALTLREKPDSYVVEQLFVYFPSVRELLTATETELQAIRGIGPVKARQLAAALHLARKMPLNDEELPTIKSPQDVFALMADMQYLDREKFSLVGLDTKNKVLIKDVVSIGSLNSSIVHPREVFKPLIRFSCAAAILCHNHPSGNPTPSSEDVAVTKRLVEAGKLLGIEILDHIVIGCN